MPESINNPFGRKLPTSTALFSRLCLFEPTNRPRLRTGEWIQNPYGSCAVEGRLGQTHFDVLEALLYSSDMYSVLNDSRIVTLVDPYKVSKCLRKPGKTVGNYSSTYVKKLIQDMLDIQIAIESKKFSLSGALIQSFDYTAKDFYDPLRKENRSYWRLIFDPMYNQLFTEDIRLFHNPHKIRGLSSALSKAIVRLLFTHNSKSSYGWKLDTLIRLVSISDIDSSKLAKERSKIHNDLNELASLGIMLCSSDEQTSVCHLKHEL